MRRLSATMLLCLCLVLAGCSGFLGSSAESPPGVEDDELVDSEALLDAHESALTESGYEHDVELTSTQKSDGQLVTLEQRQRVSVTAGAGQYFAQEIVGGDLSSRTLTWGNETTAYRSVESGDQRQFFEVDPSETRSLSGAVLLEPHLEAGFEVTETTERDGHNLFVLEATDSPDESRVFPADAENVRNYEARLVVDSEGRIHEFAASAEYDIGGESVPYEFSYELTSLSDPGVEQPSWVEQIEDSS